MPHLQDSEHCGPSPRWWAGASAQMFHVKQSRGKPPSGLERGTTTTCGGSAGSCPSASGRRSGHPSASTRRSRDTCTNYRSRYPSDPRRHPRTAGPPPASDSTHPASVPTGSRQGTATDPYSKSHPDRCHRTPCTCSTHDQDSSPSSPTTAAADCSSPAATAASPTPERP